MQRRYDRPPSLSLVSEVQRGQASPLSRAMVVAMIIRRSRFGAVQSNPLRELFFAKGSRCECDDGRISILRLCRDLAAVQFQKEAASKESGAFVAVCKRMILRKPEGIRRSQRRQIARATIEERVLRSRERQFQHSFVTKTGRSAETSKSGAVKKFERLPLDPNRFFHFANAAKVSL